MSFSILFAALVASTAVLAAPVSSPANATAGSTGCSISNAKPNLPSTQTNFTAPAGTPVYIGLSVGMQNYTCGSAGTPTYAGAVAKVFDLSCLVDSPIFPGIQDMVYNAAGDGTSQPLLNKIETIMKAPPVVLGDHYFVSNGTELTAIFDLRNGAKKGDPQGYVAFRKDNAKILPSPAGGSNIPWLTGPTVAGIGGQFVSAAMRVDTKGGQPPASCTPNVNLTVPFTAKYWAYK